MGERNTTSYAEAGVDIDAGNALVERIGPMARATSRPGAATGLGGFGALFDLKAAGYADPILVAATDGVGTKLRIARARNPCSFSTTTPQESWTSTPPRRCCAA